MRRATIPAIRAATMTNSHSQKQQKSEAATLCAAIIGDVHGCLSEAKALMTKLRAAGFRPEDTLVLLGDLVDKGPDAAGCVRFFRAQADAGQRTVLCMGNHEEKHARWRRNVARERAGGAQNAMHDDTGELAALSDALSAEDLAFLDAAVLYHRLPWADALVVHAGLMPNLVDLPSLAVVETLSRSKRSRLERVLRLRYWNVLDERFVPFGEETEVDVFWAERYDGRHGHVFFGHEPFVNASAPVQFAHATSLDLGCVHGGRLVAAVLVDGQKPSFVSVPADRVYSPAILGRDE